MARRHLGSSSRHPSSYPSGELDGLHPPPAGAFATVGEAVQTAGRGNEERALDEARSTGGSHTGNPVRSARREAFGLVHGYTWRLHRTATNADRQASRPE